jgi:hypothetical protein
MHLVYGGDYDLQEALSDRGLIFMSIWDGMTRILDASHDAGYSLSLPNAFSQGYQDNQPFPFEALDSVWNDPNIQELWKEQRMTHLPEKCVHSQSLSLHWHVA